jgi:hypothetical protein
MVIVTFKVYELRGWFGRYVVGTLAREELA